MLTMWRDVSRDSLVEPWDWYYDVGRTSRQLSPRIPHSRLTALNAAVGKIWALASLRSSPGARHHFDARRAAGGWNRQAQRHLFNKFLGQLQKRGKGNTRGTLHDPAFVISKLAHRSEDLCL